MAARLGARPRPPAEMISVSAAIPSCSPTATWSCRSPISTAACRPSCPPTAARAGPRRVSIANAPSHGEDGGLRSAGLPSAAIDGAGTVYLSWSDCSFESGCSANDIVYSSSSGRHSLDAEGRAFRSIPSAAASITSSTAWASTSSTSGSTAHMAMTYYYYPVSNCGSNCQLYAGFTLSNNGGQTWTAARALSAPMQLSWLPNTFSGQDGGGLRCHGLSRRRQSVSHLRPWLIAPIGWHVSPGHLHRRRSATRMDEMTGAADELGER